jgi:hypothetical protein
MAEQQTVFRQSPFPLRKVAIRGAILAVALAAVLNGLLLLFEPTGLGVGLFFIGTAVLGAIGAFAVFGVQALVARFQRVSLSPAGIRGFNRLGRTSFMAWSAIREARPATFLGLRYLRLSGSGQEVWVPLFLENMGRFDALLRQYLNADHPLVRARSWGR